MPGGDDGISVVRRPLPVTETWPPDGVTGPAVIVETRAPSDSRRTSPDPKYTSAPAIAVDPNSVTVRHAVDRGDGRIAMS